MKRCKWFIAILGVCIILSGTVFAADQNKSDLPWEKAYLNLGWYWANLNSGFRISSGTIGLGIDVDVEDTLGLKTDDNAFRIDIGWRFSKNKRHKVEYSWFRFDREGTKTFDESITIPGDDEGEEITIGPGRLDSVFKFDIHKVKYEYSFVLDDRVDLNLGVGLFIMPIKFGLQGAISPDPGDGFIESITAPLPVAGLGFDFAITPKWFIRQQTDVFYLEFENFKGSILSTAAALEYLPWKHVGFGLGIDAMRVNVEADGEDYPEIDFKGAFNFTYFGAQLYLKIYM